MTVYLNRPAAPVSDASIAHLAARLEVLETRVAQLVEHRRAERALRPADHDYRGVYLSDSDIDALLAGRSAVPPVDGAVGDLVAQVVREAAARGEPTRLHHLQETFALTDFDVDVLVATVAPDLDVRFELLYGFLHDDVTRRRPTAGLMLSLAGLPTTDGWARSRLSHDGPLVGSGLLEVLGVDRPFLSRGLRVPDRVCAFLLGEDAVDASIAPYVTTPVPAPVPGTDEAVRALDAGCRLIYAREGAGGSGTSLACSAYTSLGVPTFQVDVRNAPGELTVEAFVAALIREAGLRDAAVTVHGVDGLDTRSPLLLQRLTELPTVTTLVGSAPWDPDCARASPYLVEAAPLPPEASLRMLRTALGEEWPVDVEWVESGSRLRPVQAVRAAGLASLRAAAAGRPVSVDDITFGTRQQNGVGLERLARRITPVASWQQLVVRPSVETVLRQLVARVRHRSLVLDGWGLKGTTGRRRGVTAVFSGPPGTGKTMSAEVVAADLGVDLYVINLATVVDKYIGETEKNLERIFAEAEQVNGVLFFDEADAIFGRRSEVKDARDRYANVEVAYLLQRIEVFDGIAILATNLKANLDEAFLRRLDLAADFASPNAEERLTLWRQMLASVPRDEVDLEYLAETFELTGGYIRNIVIAAAFLAAQAGDVVSMRHLVRATAQEYRKLGRLVVDSEFGRHHRLLRDEP
jgi:Winged helix domain, variant/ATPase family associated with various cellular activities (AAA)